MQIKIIKNITIASLLLGLIIFSAFRINKTGRQNKVLGKTVAEWFPQYDFNPEIFQQAPREFGPFTRWWWPGNDVTNEELQREIKMFAENGFAGVEVQPLTMGLNPKAPKEQADRIYSWDTPSFYEHLGKVMEQARESAVTVDMNGGSGWPLGGAFFDPRDGMKTLAVSDTSLAGGQTFNGTVPSPHNHDARPSGMMGMMMQGNFVDNDWAVIKSVIAARVVKQEKGQTLLDPLTMVDLTERVQNRNLNWRAPDGGDWRIIVSWDIPTGEKPSLIASTKTCYVIDHLDPRVVNYTYDYLLGEHSGLQKYYGNPLRAVFNDSYEFHTDRMISPDFLKVFKSLNGYDIAPYLSTVFQRGYDHPTYLAAVYPNAKPPFSFSETENWRMMYDYDKTVNEVFKNNFIRTSDNWMEGHGLLHRTQAYGFPGDLIGNGGEADIPEAEQLFAQGSEGYLKLVTSGAHLNNRPVITQESFVSIYRAEMTTPQKIKIWADKSFACGINELIYHGTPYKYNNGEYGNEGWNTWSSPFMPFINFSTGMNESDPFWKDIKTVNQYIARCQYALRAGKPKTDVLIYMPFIDFTEDQIAMNPEEILYLGYFKGVEPEISGSGVFDAPKTPINIWYTKLWKLVNELEAKGISYEFVNDGGLQKAKLDSGQLNIEGNHYQALVLANLPYISLPTAVQINKLSKEGLPVWLIGQLPAMQPSYLNQEKNDRQTKELVEEIGRQKNSVITEDALPLDRIHAKISFLNHPGFTRQITREMADGSEIRFIWNKSDQWQTLSLELDKSFIYSYWLNPAEGSVHKTGEHRSSTLDYVLPPYGSVILYAAKKEVAQKLLSPPAITGVGAKDLLKIENWSLQVGDVHIDNGPLFDWQTADQLKYKSGEGIYSASFEIKKLEKGKHYFIDLGKLFFTADVSINGTKAGKLLFSPYRLDISSLLREGENKIRVIVTTTRRNGFIGEALNGNQKYLQFKGKENTTISSGLVGPVFIRVI